MYGIRPSHLPASRRQRARLDNHAAAQAKYRAKLRDKNAPDRDDLARAALTVCLYAFHEKPTDEIIAGIRRAIISELMREGFDRTQTIQTFDRMAERIHRDRETRKRWRDWKAENATPSPEDDSESPGDRK